MKRNKLLALQIDQSCSEKFQTGNWEAENPLLGEFDLIIGSDVLYEPAQAELVSQFIDCHSSDNVKVVIVDPNRGNRSNFTKKMVTLGYTHHFERFNEQGSDDVSCKGRVLHYQRQGHGAATRAISSGQKV